MRLKTKILLLAALPLLAALAVIAFTVQQQDRALLRGQAPDGAIEITHQQRVALRRALRELGYE